MTSLFGRHENAITTAWRQVIDDHDPTDWLLLGYEGQHDHLKLVSSGCYGLQELANEFNPGQVMYAYCRVSHPKTQLATFFIINWIGEGAPVHRKASSAAHQFEVNKFVKYSSLSIQARSEDDVEEESILARLARCATTEYDFSSKNRSDPCEEQVLPVGTNYSRVKAEREIDLKAKTRFWSQVKEDEEKRKQEEHSRKVNERQNACELAKQRLEQGNHGNGKQSVKGDHVLRNLNNDQQGNGEGVATNNGSNGNRKKIDVPIQERESFWAAQEHEERQRRHEEQMRRDEQRRRIEMEIQARDSSAKVLKRNYDQWQTHDALANGNGDLAGGKRVDIKPNSHGNNGLDTQVENKENKENMDNLDNQTLCDNRIDASIDKQSQFEYNNGYNHLNGNDVSIDEIDNRTIDMNEYEQLYDNNVIDPNAEEIRLLQHKIAMATEQLEEHVEDDEEDLDEELCLTDVLQPRRRCLEVIAEEEEEEENVKSMGQLPQQQQQMNTQAGRRARAIYDYQASDDQEISFLPDDIITDVQLTFESWWEGRAPDSKYGLFPANYVKLID